MKLTLSPRFRPIRILAAAAAAAFLCSCASAPWRPADQPPPERAVADPTVVAVRAKLAEGGRSVVGRKELVVRGRRFSMDCTGVVLAVYWYAGIDLSRDFKLFSGNGVTRIYKTLEREGLLYSNARPLTGDVIFWDNTYDYDRDGQWNDGLTHVGMVVNVDDDDTVSYVHYHIRRGIVVDYMNLRSPEVQSRMEEGSMKILNSALRLAEAGKPHPPNWLSGQLYRGLGMGYLYQ